MPGKGSDWFVCILDCFTNKGIALLTEESWFVDVTDTFLALLPPVDHLRSSRRYQIDVTREIGGGSHKSGNNIARSFAWDLINVGASNGSGGGVEHLGQTLCTKKVAALEKARAAVGGIKSKFTARARHCFEFV